MRIKIRNFLHVNSPIKFYNKESPPKCFETICLRDGVLENISFHQRRVVNTFKSLYRFKKCAPDLINYISVPKQYLKGFYKCRIVYDENEIEVSFEPYVIKKIESIKLVKDNSINYSYKFYERSEINNLLNKWSSFSDIIITKNSLLTDSSYANICFLDYKGQWFTPKVPLLYGTMREKLLENKEITPVDICVNDISRFHKISLINAMLPLGTIQIPINKVFT